MSSKARSIQNLKPEIDKNRKLQQELSVDTPPGHAEIAQRAYEIYVKRDNDDGHDLDDWLQAERELQRKQP
jgi:hypothetical protein